MQCIVLCVVCRECSAEGYSKCFDESVDVFAFDSYGPDLGQNVLQSTEVFLQNVHLCFDCTERNYYLQETGLTLFDSFKKIRHSIIKSLF